jgi:hypothetical protein
MKKLFSWISIAALPIMACTQDIPTDKVPSVVQNAVATKFANASGIEWEKKNANYEAEFKIDNIEHTVWVAPTGVLLWIKKELAIDKLPVVIAQGIRRDHPTLILDEADELEKDGIVYYQVELEKKNAKDIKLVY